MPQRPPATGKCRTVSRRVLSTRATPSRPTRLLRLPARTMRLASATHRLGQRIAEVQMPDATRTAVHAPAGPAGSRCSSLTSRSAIGWRRSARRVSQRRAYRSTSPCRPLCMPRSTRRPLSRRCRHCRGGRTCHGQSTEGITEVARRAGETGGPRTMTSRTSHLRLLTFAADPPPGRFCSCPASGTSSCVLCTRCVRWIVKQIDLRSNTVAAF